MKKYFNPVVMAGGIGSRLWPLSRSLFPKQFQELVANKDNHTMLQQTFQRLSGLSIGLTQLICNQDHRFLAAEQCRAINMDAQIILEPMGRNTAPVVILSALRLLEADSDDPMLILSADHAVSDEKSFRSALSDAHELAVSGNIVTLGIEPTFACTGYGYIRYGKKIKGGYKASQFVEKPEEKVAQDYLSKGNYLWNSGNFVVRPSVLIDEAEEHCPELLRMCRKNLQSVEHDLDFIRLSEQEFSKCESISIDFAIMEHTKIAAVIKVDCGWSDIGDLQALWNSNKSDNNGNVLKGDVVSRNAQDCLVRADNRLVVILGVDNIAVVETEDAVLISSLDYAQQVKDLVLDLKNREEIVHHREVFRPWGSYDSIDSGTNYQVKLIKVNPGCSLSLQRHKHRAEHWVVVEGVANVHLDGVDRVLNTNDSIYIPVGSTHRLENATDQLVQLVEVQSGSYLGEDDIERFEDIYGRN